MSACVACSRTCATQLRARPSREHDRHVPARLHVPPVRAKRSLGSQRSLARYAAAGARLPRLMRRRACVERRSAPRQRPAPRACTCAYVCVRASACACAPSGVASTHDTSGWQTAHSPAPQPGTGANAGGAGTRRALHALGHVKQRKSARSAASAWPPPPGCSAGSSRQRCHPHSHVRPSAASRSAAASRPVRPMQRGWYACSGVVSRRARAPQRRAHARRRGRKKAERAATCRVWAQQRPHGAAPWGSLRRRTAAPRRPPCTRSTPSRGARPAAAWRGAWGSATHTSGRQNTVTHRTVADAARPHARSGPAHARAANPAGARTSGPGSRLGGGGGLGLRSGGGRGFGGGGGGAAAASASLARLGLSHSSRCRARASASSSIRRGPKAGAKGVTRWEEDPVAGREEVPLCVLRPIRRTQ
jgi:hypothetical protein